MTTSVPISTSQNQPTTLTAQTPTSLSSPVDLSSVSQSSGAATTAAGTDGMTIESVLSDGLQELVKKLSMSEQNLVYSLLVATGRGRESSIVGNTVNPSTINQFLRNAAQDLDKTLYNLILLACVTSPNGELREGGLMYAEAWRSIRHPGEGVLKASEAKFLAMNVLEGIPTAQDPSAQLGWASVGFLRGNWLSDGVSLANGDPSKITLTQLGRGLPEGQDWWGLAGTVASGIVGAIGSQFIVPLLGPIAVTVSQVPRALKQWNQNAYLEKLRDKTDSNTVISFLLTELGGNPQYAALAKHLAEDAPSSLSILSSSGGSDDGGGSGDGSSASEGEKLAEVLANEGSSRI